MCPLNQMLGGNSNNLINSLLLFFLKSVWLCNGGGCHIWCKHKEIKTYRCYFLCSVVLQYIFFYFCCLNERNIVVLIFHHQRPSWLFATLREAGGCCVLLFLFFFLLLFLSSGFFCMLFLHTHPLTDPAQCDRRLASSCFLRDHAEKKPPRWDEERDAKVALLALCYRSKDAALCCRDHGCNIKTDGPIHDGAAASAAWTLPPKFFICRKVGHQSSLTSALLQSPKKMPVALIFSPLLQLLACSTYALSCAYDH